MQDMLAILLQHVRAPNSPHILALANVVPGTEPPAERPYALEALAQSVADGVACLRVIPSLVLVSPFLSIYPIYELLQV